MKATSTGVGRYGEELAAQFLIERGYSIIQRNLQVFRHEVDIVAQKDNMIIFVEVKTRTNEDFGIGLEHVTWAKQKRLIRAAQFFSAHEQKQVRFDVISIKLDPETQQVTRMIHTEDAFRL